MKLTDLDPRFTKWDPKLKKDGTVKAAIFKHVKELKQADSVWFLCPKCFEQNKGPVGTHSIRIDFHGRNVPDEYAMHNDRKEPVRWHVSGTGLSDLTLSPSILLLGGCNWHGFVREGQIVHA